jgi:hypothetical protein
VRVTIIGLDVEGMLHILQPHLFQASMIECKRRLGSPVASGGRDRLEAAFEFAETVIDGIDYAIEVICNERLFTNPSEVRRARECLGNGLELTASPCGSSV